jgi:phage gpG-like protein
MTFKKNPNIDNIIKQKRQEGLSRAAITLQNEIKMQLSLSSSPSKAGSPPGVNTGTLRRSIQIDNTELDYLKIRVGTNVKYAAIQNFGGVVKAKIAKYLHYKIGQLWHTTKSVILPARPFIAPSLLKCKPTMLACFKDII